MDENSIKASVEALIKANELNATIVGFDATIVGFEDYDDYPRIRVEVDSSDFQRAFSLDCYSDDYSIQWEQKVPLLQEAKVGDLVLIFGSHDGSDEDSDVGLVSSKFTYEDGSVCYGCRYIKIGLNNQYVNHLYDFEITSEDHGGFHEGFLRVLTPQEAIDCLRNQINVAHRKELESVQSKFERTNKHLESLILALNQSRKLQCEKIELDEDHLPVSVKTECLFNVTF